MVGKLGSLVVVVMLGSRVVVVVVGGVHQEFCWSEDIEAFSTSAVSWFENNPYDHFLYLGPSVLSKYFVKKNYKRTVVVGGRVGATGTT